MKKLFILVLFLVSCTGGGVETDVETTSYGHNYVVVDGMPCLIYEGVDEYAMTCDWSKWEGTVDGGLVVLGE